MSGWWWGGTFLRQLMLIWSPGNTLQLSTEILAAQPIVILYWHDYCTEKRHANLKLATGWMGPWICLSWQIDTHCATIPNCIAVQEHCAGHNIMHSDHYSVMNLDLDKPHQTSIKQFIRSFSCWCLLMPTKIIKQKGVQGGTKICYWAMVAN